MSGTGKKSGAVTGQRSIPRDLAGMALALLVVTTLAIAITPGRKHDDDLDRLAAMPAGDLLPTGDLARLYSATAGEEDDTRRTARLREINGQVVRWELPVHAIEPIGDYYRVSTAASPQLVSAAVYLSPRTDDDRTALAALRHGSVVSFQGRIHGHDDGRLEIRPAVLVESRTAGRRATATRPVASGRDLR